MQWKDSAKWKSSKNAEFLVVQLITYIFWRMIGPEVRMYMDLQTVCLREL